MLIRDGTLEEIQQVNLQIEEFAVPYERPVLDERLAGRSWIGLVAENPSGDIVGFKLGYEERPGEFYSWIGGVLSEARGQGAAKLMLLEQERRLREQGYSGVRVKARNRFQAMLMLLLSQGYLVTEVIAQDDPLDNRICFEKPL